MVEIPSVAGWCSVTAAPLIRDVSPIRSAVRTALRMRKGARRLQVFYLLLFRPVV